MSDTIQDVLESAEESLREEADDNGIHNLEDRIHEIADGAIPVYTSELLEMAARDNGLAMDTPEIEGDGSPINTIQLNIFERVSLHLYDVVETIKEEIQEREDNLQEAKEALEEEAMDHNGHELGDWREASPNGKDIALWIADCETCGERASIEIDEDGDIQYESVEHDMEDDRWRTVPIR